MQRLKLNLIPTPHLKRMLQTIINWKFSATLIIVNFMLAEHAYANPFGKPKTKLLELLGYGISFGLILCAGGVLICLVKVAMATMKGERPDWGKIGSIALVAVLLGSFSAIIKFVGINIIVAPRG